MEFNDLQKKLWAKMLRSIESYRKGNLLYSEFIYGLEGCLDAGEFHDENLVLQWYKHWTPLEFFFRQEAILKRLKKLINTYLKWKFF